MTDQSLATGAHSAEHLDVTERFAAHNYHPLPVVLSTGEGAWVTDVDGRRYLDCLAGYSALNFGHGHPRLREVAHRQLDRLTLTSQTSPALGLKSRQKSSSNFCQSSRPPETSSSSSSSSAV